MEGTAEPRLVGAGHGDTDSPVAAFVSGLAAGSPVVPVTAPEDLAVLAAGLPPGAVDWAAALGHRCSDVTRISQSEHAAELTEDDTRRAIEGSMFSLLRRLCGDSSVPVLNERQLILARIMARLNWPYERYVLGLRIAQDMALDDLLTHAVKWGRAEDRPALLIGVTHEVAAFFDDSVRLVLTEFLAERQRAIAQSVAERRRLVAALVTGHEVPADVAAATLGIDLAHHHLALVLWRPGTSKGNSDALRWSKSQLELAVNRAAGRLRAPATLTMPPDDGLTDIHGDAMLCWLTNPVPFSSGYLEHLKELFASSRDIRVAVGVPATGTAGFRRSYLAAVDAYQVAAADARTGVTGYAEAGVLALLSADQERAGWFVSEELGKLAEAGPALDDLRETALRYLETGRNLMDTARRLHVHRNTVVYRVAKIERLLGRPLEERPFATQAALILAAQKQALEWFCVEDCARSVNMTARESKTDLCAAANNQEHGHHVATGSQPQCHRPAGVPPRARALRHWCHRGDVQTSGH